MLDNHKVNVENTKITTENISMTLSVSYKSNKGIMLT